MNCKNLLSSLAVALMAASVSPAVAADTSDLTVWGYYKGDDVSKLGTFGLNKATSYNVGMLLSTKNQMVGAILEGVNIPIASKAHLTDLTVWVADNDVSLTRLKTYSVDLSNFNEHSYNTVLFGESVKVPVSGLYVGYSFTITEAKTAEDKKPVYIYESADDENSLMLGVPMKDGSIYWGDYSSQYGALAMQVLLSGLDVPEYCAHFSHVNDFYTVAGKSTQVPVSIYSDGSETITEIEYAVTINGERTLYTCPVSVKGGFGQEAEVMIDITGPAATGLYKAELQLIKINGHDNEQSDKKIQATVTNVARKVARRTLVEEFTGTGCPWCPGGLAGMKMLKEKYPDTFVGVAIHQYNADDPLCIASYNGPNFTYAPASCIDRKEILDPFWGNYEDAPYVCGDFERYNSLFAEADIKLTAYWKEGTDFSGNDLQVDLEATTTALMDDNYSIVFVITGDSLIGASSLWRQANNYAQYSSVGAPEYLIDFTSGQTYGTTYFYYPFDDVALVASYSGNRSTAPAIGKLQAEQSVTSQMTLKLPTQSYRNGSVTKLMDAIKQSIDKIYGVAIVVNSKGQVANAVRVRVIDRSEADIKTVEQEAPAMQQSFDLMGRPVTDAASYRGMMVRNGKIILQK